MEFEKEGLEYEKSRLERVLTVIGQQLEKSRGALELFRKEVIKTQRSMWDEVNPTPHDLDDYANVWQYQVDIEREGRKAIFEGKQTDRLERMLRSPYFGRIDFREEDAQDVEKIYIGISNLTDEKTSEYLVFDWRAPVSSMFYDYETGYAQYTCPGGIIEGDLLLKRQYRIWKGELEYMFDCSLKIDDEILQEILSHSADNRMRTIVTSIQREQNRVIRDETHRLLVVQGAAGSGKTSIALHRAAYLLYRYKDSMRADNIVIFSPNQIFNDYISNVLPELGEENMRRTTFMQYAWSVLGKSAVLEDMSGQMEFILGSAGEEGHAARTAGIRYKSSEAFSRLLAAYIRHMEKSYAFEDVEYMGERIETAAELESYFHRDMAVLPVAKRLEKIRNRIFLLLDAPMRKRVEEVMQELADTGEYVDKGEMKARSVLLVREEMQPLKDRIEKMTAFDAVTGYTGLFQDKELLGRLAGGSVPGELEKICSYTLAALGTGKIFYEDLAPLLFFKGMLEGFGSRSDIKHVIIDEVQDYTPVHFEVFRQLFGHCGITMLGDLSQSINPYMNLGSYETAISAINSPKTAMIQLSKSYRSTRQITEFCRALLKVPDDTEYINREGELPRVVTVNGKAIPAEEDAGTGERRLEEGFHDGIVKEVLMLSEKGCASIAVICRTEKDCTAMYERIGKQTGARLLSSRDEEFSTGVLVIPSYLAKGLEFDGVIVCDEGDGGYGREEEIKLFYTICARALHNLTVFCRGRRSVFLEGVDPTLYVVGYL